MWREHGWTLTGDRPSPDILILLPAYEFVITNRRFSLKLITARSVDKQTRPPLANFLSCASYLLQNAYRSSRSATYASLILLIFQILMEDMDSAKAICNVENKCLVRLCRQRPPLIPPMNSEVIPVSAMLDIAVGGLTHNLRIRLDIEFYE